MPDINARVFLLVEQGNLAYKNEKYQNAEDLYNQALELAERCGIETNFIFSSLVKVYKKLGLYDKGYQISKQAIPTPAAFNDCAVLLRKIIQASKKDDQTTRLSETLDELYRLSVLAFLCYGPHDCKSGVAGSLFERAEYIVQQLPLGQIQATYTTKGILTSGGILTERDYRFFTDTFGQNDSLYNPNEDYSELIHTANETLWQKLQEI